MSGDELIDAYTDGTLPPDQHAHLIAWLKENPENLRKFTAALVFENDLRLAAEAELKPIAVTPIADEPTPPSRLGGWRIALMAAAAVILAACLSLLLTRITAPSAIVTVSELSGTLSWTGPDGETTAIPATGARLHPGTFETTGENSRATLTFHDGTRLDLRGDARAAISERGQKQIHLQSGRMRADVHPQKHGKPLLVRTSTARLEVLGTVFSVNAASGRTTMNVEQGRVKFSRLADGGAVIVPAAHAAAASFETSAPLVTTPASSPPEAWRWTADRPLPSAGRGEWTPPSAASPGYVSSIPIVVGTDAASGRPLVQHGINLREESSGTRGSFVTLAPESALTFRYHAAKPSQIVIFFSTQRQDGSFGGNFEYQLPSGSGQAVGDGWREVTLTLRDAPPLQPEVASTPADHGITSLGIRSFRQDARLRFSTISISSP